MAHIQQLSPHVADLIAAGEVVERPASVVKELLENAIDAGASAIVVEIQNGGMTYIRVTDNGCGIAPEELPTAFLRHATSKLRHEADLAAIGTLGFRGEALAAIAAVSRIDILSRTAQSDTGASLELTGGVPGELQPTGCPQGTTIIVRDLFFNTPARMKFMKKDTAEASAISGIVQHLSLSHPAISFQLIRDGQETLHTPGDGKLLSAIYAAQGRDFAMGLLETRGESGGVKVEGYITKPLSARGTRGMQSFFVNGRYVKSQLLTAALEEAYRNELMRGKFPGCVLLVTLPVHEVDVNVHPAKTVVKFLSDKQVFDAVYYTALDTLHGKKKEEPQPRDVSQTVNPRGDFYRSMSAREYREAGQIPQSKPAAKFAASSFQTRIPPVQSELRGKTAVADVAPLDRRTPAAPPAPQPPKAAPVPLTPPSAPPAPPAQPTTDAEPAQTQLLPTAQTPWRIAGEVLRTYIVCEAEDGSVWLIDKHAAHERIIFDRLKAATEPIMSQLLLAPVAVELPGEAYSAALENLALLQEFGFHCEDFGGSLLIREIPADINAEDAASTLEELSEQLALGRAKPDAMRDGLLHTMACKAAIKAGMVSDRRELAALVEKVQNGQIRYCPHGRPVAVQLTRYELEKMFKRA